MGLPLVRAQAMTVLDLFSGIGGMSLGLESVGSPTGRRLAGPGSSDAGALPAAPALRWPARPGEPQRGWEAPRLVAHAGHQRRRAGGSEAADGGAGRSQLGLGCAVAGLPERLVRRANRAALRTLGNAVVPQVVAQIGLAILAAEARIVA